MHSGGGFQCFAIAQGSLKHDNKGDPRRTSPLGVASAPPADHNKVQGEGVGVLAAKLRERIDASL